MKEKQFCNFCLFNLSDVWLLSKMWYHAYLLAVSNRCFGLEYLQRLQPTKKLEGESPLFSGENVSSEKRHFAKA